MEQANPAAVKHREIGFRDPHPDPQQAQTAVLLLSDVEGVLYASLPERPRNTLHIGYDLSHICLRVLESLLTELGFHLDNSLLAKLKRALYYYTEQAEQETLGCQRGRGNCTQAIFINRYQHLQHGCRDDRPDHWRHYR